MNKYFYNKDCRKLIEMDEYGLVTVFEQLDGIDDEERVEEVEEKIVDKPKKLGKKAGRKVTSCGSCGKDGHTKRSCPDLGNRPKLTADEKVAKMESYKSETPESPAPADRLTPDRLSSIKRFLSAGWTVADIADKVDVSEETVDRVATSLGL